MLRNLKSNGPLARQRLLRQGVALIVALAVVGLGAPTVASGGDQCASSRATDELLNCAHCQAIKKILTAENIGDLTVAVHDLEHGVIVQVDATNDAAVSLAHDLAEEMWTLGRHEGPTMSKACLKREGMLGKCFVDQALTETGALVVLSSEDGGLVDWLREDARNTRGFVLSAASR